MRTNNLSVSVAQCPLCGLGHTARLALELSEPEALIFAGPGSGSTDSWDVLLTCPNREEQFTFTVHPDLRPGQHLLSVREVPATPADASLSVGVTSGVEDGSATHVDETEIERAEFTAWVQGSVSTARDTAKSTSATATALVPVYFTVLGYVGIKNPPVVWRVAGLVPPILFVACALTAALAVRPSLRAVRPGPDFVAWRAERLSQMARLQDWATGFLVSGIVVASLVWAYLVL